MRNQALTELVLGPYKCSSSFWACHAHESLRDHCTSWGWAATGLQMKESYLDVNTGDEMWYVDIFGKNIADHCPLQSGRALRQNHYFLTQGSNCCGSRQQQRAEEDLSSATLKCFKGLYRNPENHFDRSRRWTTVRVCFCFSFILAWLDCQGLTFLTIALGQGQQFSYPVMPGLMEQLSQGCPATGFWRIQATADTVLCRCYHYLPIVPHKAVAEVSKIGNL